MFIVDVDALQTVDFLDFIHQVLLQFLFAQHRHDVVRIARPVHQGVARTYAFGFLHVDVHSARQRVFALFAVVADDVNLAHAFADFAVLHNAVDLTDHRSLPRLARLEQFDNARQTARDVLGLGSGAWDLGQHVARVNVIPIRHRQMRVHGHQITLFIVLAAAGGTNGDCGNPLFVD